MKQTKKSIFIFMAPAVILFMMVFLYPAVRTTLMSFFNVNLISSKISTWTFAGLDNFIKLFDTRLFIRSMINIGKIWFFCGIATGIIAILFAVLLTSGVRGQKFFRTMIYMPNVIAGIAVGYMWLLYVFNNNFGLLKTLFTKIGWTKMANFQWLSGENIFLSMCIAYVFANVGYFMLMYIAGIEKISIDYYEAAKIEGANALQQFSYITLPLIKGVISTSIVLWTTRTMGFFAMSQVFKSASTYTPMLFTYETLFGTEVSATSMNVGIAAASALAITIVVLIISITTRKLIKDESYEI